MITDPYPYYEIKDNTHYLFESVGVKGNVLKAVVFTLSDENIWNLGFGDLKNGLIDDSIITNNQDAAKVIRTVAKIAIRFLVRNSGHVIEIKPVDEKRHRLYNSVFQKYFNDIEPLFNILGTFEGQEEIYSPSQSYDSFKITFKF